MDKSLSAGRGQPARFTTPEKRFRLINRRYANDRAKRANRNAVKRLNAAAQTCFVRLTGCESHVQIAGAEGNGLRPDGFIHPNRRAVSSKDD
jgi:hypothetical protein